VITLTNRPTRVLLWSFWLVLVAGACILAALVLWVAGAGAWSALSAALFLALVLAGRIRPALTESAYRTWRRLAGGVARRATGLLTRTAFLVVAVVGLAGGDLETDLPSAGGSGWRRRSPLSDAYRSVSDEAERAEGHGWLGSLGSWARRSGNGWVWSLIPILSLLRLVSSERSAAAAGTTYTLY
jgi:hypothetical protein